MARVSFVSVVGRFFMSETRQQQEPEERGSERRPERRSGRPVEGRTGPGKEPGGRREEEEEGGLDRKMHLTPRQQPHMDVAT